MTTTCAKFLLVALLALLLATPAHAADQRYMVTAQKTAFAPNAGGQEAYSLKFATASYEVNAFSNQYLLAGGRPLTGVVYDFRLPVCDDSCFWQFYVQAGGGLSTAGPLGEVTWAAIIPLLPLWLPTRAPKYYPALRIDITNQFVFLQTRAVTWSYPLWTGITIPF